MLGLQISAADQTAPQSSMRFTTCFRWDRAELEVDVENGVWLHATLDGDVREVLALAADGSFTWPRALASVKTDAQDALREFARFPRSDAAAERSREDLLESHWSFALPGPA